MVSLLRGDTMIVSIDQPMGNGCFQRDFKIDSRLLLYYVNDRSGCMYSNILTTDIK